MKKITRNPFILTPYVPEEYFCDRKEETAQLCKHIENGRNVALFARRRLGKTGLIRHCFEQASIKSGFNTFLVDIYSARSIKDLTTLFAKEIFSQANILGFRDKLLQGIKSIRPSIEYNELTSSFSVSIKAGEISQPEKTLEELLSLVDALPKPSVIAIDEFQTICEFKESVAESYLRSVFQRCKNITFIYTGSIGHSMNNIFKSPDKPFYNSAVMMTLGVIDRTVYCDFAKKMFASAGKKIEESLVYRCYDYFEGVTWYNQLLMNEAFAQTDKGNIIREEDFDAIYNAIIAQQAFSYQDLFSRFSEKQKEVLLALAQEGKEGAQVTSQEFMSKYGIGPAGSIQTACNYLKKNNFITDINGRKTITDLIFKDWLRQN